MTTQTPTPVCTCGKHLPTARETALLATLAEVNAHCDAATTERQYATYSTQANRLEAHCLRLQRDRLRRADKACPAAGSTIWAKAV